MVTAPSMARAESAGWGGMLAHVYKTTTNWKRLQ